MVRPPKIVAVMVGSLISDAGISNRFRSGSVIDKNVFVIFIITSLRLHRRHRRHRRSPRHRRRTMNQAL
jgi:hypothetical protein